MSKFEKLQKNIDNKLLTIKYVGSRGEGISNSTTILIRFQIGRDPAAQVGCLLAASLALCLDNTGAGLLPALKMRAIYKSLSRKLVQ